MNNDNISKTRPEAAMHDWSRFDAMTEADFDLVYQGSLTNLANPSGTIVLKEKQAWQRPDGLWEKVYGFADGHAESHGEPNGDFNAWERQRLVLPGAN